MLLPWSENYPLLENSYNTFVVEHKPCYVKRQPLAYTAYEMTRFRLQPNKHSQQ